MSPTEKVFGGLFLALCFVVGLLLPTPYRQAPAPVVQPSVPSLIPPPLSCLCGTARTVVRHRAQRDLAPHLDERQTETLQALLVPGRQADVAFPAAGVADAARSTALAVVWVIWVGLPLLVAVNH